MRDRTDPSPSQSPPSIDGPSGIRPALTASRRLDRRAVFKLSAVAAAHLGGILGASRAGAQAPSDEELSFFTVDIPGAPNASRGIVEVEIDELEITPRRRRGSPEDQFRLYGPGHAHWGSASFTSSVTLGASKELQTWFNDAAKGRNIRKNITVTLFRSDTTPGRSFNLLDCFPTQWSAVNFDTSSTVQTETIRVKLGRVEFKT